MNRYDDKKQDKKKLLMSSFIVFIMFGSILGYGLIYAGSSTKRNVQNVEYNGYEFVKDGDFWVTNVNDQPFLFQYTPKQVENINFDAFTINNEKVYIAYDPEENVEFTLPFNKISAVLTPFNVRSVRACINNKCEGLPLVSCDNENPVIYLKNSPETRIYTDQNCIVLEGDTAMASDRLNFAFLGVIR